METPVLILAAGRSSRMRGADKLLQPVGGVPLLRRQVLSAMTTGGPVLVALPGPDDPRAAVLQGLPAVVVPVPDAAQGMSASLRRGVLALPDCDRFLVLLPDLAELAPEDLRAALDAPATAPDALIWRGATEDGKPGHPILFDATLRPEFADLTGDTGGAPIIAAHADRVHLVPLPGQRARRDLDTPEDWDRFRRDTGL
ncbi:nucleotidyltransferase family protein [Loktanella sp. IMCC34160]|uniref:nucleotidyltransferase family protein n=1 Tax=Loktanella sp. IMCC34160 TaxID=2510646 RepID=UPI00101CB5DF|nr:nucleotidyltransferase family protein [Loktanella sp. IMCC34160]RYG92157.1 nucleotidyltransferase family protein [Loktanella sp. IMCC34160]